MSDATSQPDQAVPASTRPAQQLLPRLKTPFVAEADAAVMPGSQPGAINGADARHNPMFAKLVEREDDTIGLLAYALYKQTKRDWLIAFQQAHGRIPTEGEASAFITGEQLPRRMQTYRQLARQQLDGGHEPSSSEPSSSGPSSPLPNVAPPVAKVPSFALNKATLRYLAIMTGLVVGMAIVFRIVAGWLFR